MDIEIRHARFEGRGMKLRTAGFFSGPRLLLDGVVLQGKRRIYEAKDNAGATVAIGLKPRFLDPVPCVDIAGDIVELARPLIWYEYLWIGLPILLVFGGGAIGGATGFVATYSSARVFRSELNTVSKYALTGLISVGAVIVYLILAILFKLLIGGVKNN